ncbi:hypothetical protein ACQ4LE_002478 [Meloidogyne hapla]
MFSYMLFNSERRFCTASQLFRIPKIVPINFCDIKLEKLPATAQQHYQLSNQLILWRSSTLASDSLWLSASWQLKRLLNLHGIDAPDHGLKNEIVKFLCEYCLSKKEEKDIFKMAWNSLQRAHSNSYTNEMSLDDIKYFLIKPTETFCDTINDIYENNRFNRELMFKKLPKWAKDIVKVFYEGKWLNYYFFNYIKRLPKEYKNELKAQHGEEWIVFVKKEYDEWQKQRKEEKKQKEKAKKSNDL